MTPVNPGDGLNPVTVNSPITPINRQFSNEMLIYGRQLYGGGAAGISEDLGV